MAPSRITIRRASVSSMIARASATPVCAVSLVMMSASCRRRSARRTGPPGSAGWTVTSRNPASRIIVSSAPGVKPVHRSPSRSRTHACSCATRSRTSTRPPSTSTLDASASARSGTSAWCSAWDSSATSTVASSNGNCSISPRFHSTFDTLLRRATARARSSTRADRSTATTRLAQRATSSVRNPSPHPRSATRSSGSSIASAARDQAAQLRPGTSWRGSPSLPMPCASRRSRRCWRTSLRRVSSARMTSSAVTSVNCSARKSHTEPDRASPCSRVAR